MNNVYLDSPFNSTLFTRCCRVAINDHEGRCPACKEEVYPGDSTPKRQWHEYRWRRAFAEQQKGRPA